MAEKLSKTTLVRSRWGEREIVAGTLTLVIVLLCFLSPGYLSRWEVAWSAVFALLGVVAIADGFRRAIVSDLWIVELDSDWLRITRNGQIEINGPLFNVRGVTISAHEISVGVAGTDADSIVVCPLAIVTREQANRLLELNPKASPANPPPTA